MNKLKIIPLARQNFNKLTKFIFLLLNFFSLNNQRSYNLNNEN